MEQKLAEMYESLSMMIKAKNDDPAQLNALIDGGALETLQGLVEEMQGVETV